MNTDERQKAEQSNARKTRAIQGTRGYSSIDSASAGGTEAEGSGSGCERERTDRADRALEVFLISATVGGIVGQLISDSEARLSEAEECITWYQREADKQRERLASLRALQDTLEAED